ncbi:hypothetical protein EBR25_00880 [bacterium]|nr:hypothetical protein [bacterium]
MVILSLSTDQELGRGHRYPYARKDGAYWSEGLQKTGQDQKLERFMFALCLFFPQERVKGFRIDTGLFQPIKTRGDIQLYTRSPALKFEKVEKS